MTISERRYKKLLSQLKKLKASATLLHNEQQVACAATANLINELIVIEGELEGVYPPASSKAPEITAEERVRVMSEAYKRRNIPISISKIS